VRVWACGQMRAAGRNARTAVGDIVLERRNRVTFVSRSHVAIDVGAGSVRHRPLHAAQSVTCETTTVQHVEDPDAYDYGSEGRGFESLRARNVWAGQAGCP